MAGPRLRLVKLVVTPVFVLDDGESLREQVGQQFNVAPGDLAGFPARFEADLLKAQDQMTGPLDQS